MFVATSNSMNIPAPLLDRMEVIRLSGYTEDEKLNIAKRHLLTKQIERNALKESELTVDDSAIVGIIRYYTREAGVRVVWSVKSLNCVVRRLNSCCWIRLSNTLRLMVTTCMTIWAFSASIMVALMTKTAWVRSPVWRGRKWAAIC